MKKLWSVEVNFEVAVYAETEDDAIQIADDSIRQDPESAGYDPGMLRVAVAKHCPPGWSGDATPFDGDSGADTPTIEEILEAMEGGAK